MSESKLTTRLRSGPKVRHGGYALLSGHGLPENRQYIEVYLTAFRAAVVEDLGPGEENMTALQVMLLDRLTSLLGCVRCFEEAALEDPGQKLDGHYLSFNNAVLRFAQVLGVDKKAVDGKVMSMAEVIDKIENEAQDKQ